MLTFGAMDITTNIATTDHFINANNIRQHYIDIGEGPVLVMLHGLTANCHAFDGVAAAGLSNKYRIIAPDLRGRGLTDQPAFNYSIEDHARDMVAMFQSLGLKNVYLAGHSFGGLLGMYLAAYYPLLINKLIIMDAAAEMNPQAIQMLTPAVARLERTYDSPEDYLTQIKKEPYLDNWDEHMVSYYMADIKKTANGKVTPIPNFTNIVEVSVGVGSEYWPGIIQKINQPSILINAVDDYTMDMPLLPEDKALETVAMIKDCKYIPVVGNHLTMMYNKGAQQITAAISAFLG